MSGKFWLIVLGIIGLAALYYFIAPLCYLVVVLIVLYFGYRWYNKRRVPQGHHINHGLLRGHLTSKYGDEEGGKLYQRMVRELQRKGYR